jgi:uncharacterized ferritin-like protein (DUF455 family)
VTFDRLALDLRRLGAPQAIQDMAEQGARDERAHIVLCKDLAERLGWRFDEVPEVPSTQALTDRAVSQADLLIRMVGMGCINETVSAVVLNHMLRLSQPGPVHDTIHVILQDEMGHSRIGWAYLAHMAERHDVRPLGALLPKMLEQAITDELFAGHLIADPDADATALGAVPRASRVALFTAAIEDLVFAGLARHGIDTSHGEAWLRAC